MPQSAEEEDVDDENYLNLLRGITREKVDETTIRCPHEETAKLMEQVRYSGATLADAR